MGTGDYICVTLRGGAPWGFTITEGEGDTYVPFLVNQVEEEGHAFLAGVQEGDELVSINGEPCADLTVSQAFSLIDASVDTLQLLLKRFLSGEGASSSDEFVESTTLCILPSKPTSQIQRKLYLSDSQDDTCPEDGNPKLFWTKLHDDDTCQELEFQENGTQMQRCLSPGAMVEVQVSLPEQTLDDVGCTSLGNAHGIEGETVGRTIHVTTASQYVPSPVREPLGQHGVVVSSAFMLGQVEVNLQKQPVIPGPGRGIESGGSQSEGEGGGHSEGPPRSFTVSFEVPSEKEPHAEEQDSDSDGDPDKPNKHHARHSRLRRSESLSEKQVKEAKSKCKRIALLLTAAPPNPNNKGLLMFKKHRQRAKKYTLVSFGTGEDEQEYSDSEDEESGDDTVKFTLIAGNNSELEKHFLSDANSSKGVLALNWDKGLLEITRNLENQTTMESLPETKGKGALMFAQRRQRMDEIAAEHEELRRQGIPVESVQETEKKMVEHSYMQSTEERHGYMDVNVQQKSQQQYQQYQERQYFEQHQNYHQQQEQQYQQQYQQEQYNQSQYQQQQQQQQQLQQQQQQLQQQQQQMYQQQQEYQQQMQHYSTNINGTVQHQTTEMQSSFSNRSAKPFYVENIPSTPFSHAMNATNQESVGQGEQIASRDERISTPAIKTGFLMDTRKRNTGKPMFTFKDPPKMSPNPELLNLLNRSNKKAGCESGPEEDYLSLGAEACNFLQSHGKHKIPPPVAPKPAINPDCPPWSPTPQLEATNQDMPQCAENNLPTPAVVSTTENIPGPDLEPAPAAPAPEPSPSPAPQEIPASTSTTEQQAWAHQQTESQQQFIQVASQEARDHADSKLQNNPAPVPSWGSAQTQEQQPPSSWQQGPVQIEQPQSQAPQQPPWATSQYTQNQAQLQACSTTWNSQNQQSWTQDHEQTQTSVKEPWAQYQKPTQPQSEVQPPWAHPTEQPNAQMMQPSWGQPQESMHSPAQNLGPQPSQADNQQLPPWVKQSEKPPQTQPPWIQPAQQETQHQPPWVQQPHQDLPQTWPQHAQASSQPQPPWVSAQPQQQQQPSMANWAPPQPQVQAQPPWIQGHTQSPVQPQANLNPWAPVPAQAQSQTQWAQPPPEHHSFPQEQSPVPSQPPWTQPVPSQTVPQPQWQQRPTNTPPQPPMNAWSPAETQPQAPVNPWAPQSRQTENVSSSTTNIQPSPKPWHTPKFAPQHRMPPLPPQRMHSSSPINPMATVLNPSSSGSALQMPVVRGKGADMFAKRQSRMEKFVVDSETVEANKASRSASPAASLPNEWKYSPNVRAPPSRSYNPIHSPSYPPAATKQLPSTGPTTKTKKKDKEKQTPAPKPLNVIDVMKHQPYQLNSSLFIYGPEPVKPPKPSPPADPPCDSQSMQYEQMGVVQQSGPFSGPCPQQYYGMPMQPMGQNGHNPQANVYPPANPYQQPSASYQQAYNQQYPQTAPPAYHPQTPQSPNAPSAYYPQTPQSPNASYQPANSPPYLAAPSAPYQQPQLCSSFIAPSFPVAARPESSSGGNAVASAPKPRFTAKKSSAQVWKPAAVEKE